VPKDQYETDVAVTAAGVCTLCRWTGRRGLRDWRGRRRREAANWSKTSTSVEHQDESETNPATKFSLHLQLYQPVWRDISSFTVVAVSLFYFLRSCRQTKTTEKNLWKNV